MKFEDLMNKFLTEIYAKKKRLPVSELLKEIGLRLNDENSILFQAAKNDIPIYCPGIADSSFGFQLFMFQQKNPDFIVDTIKDMERVVTDLSFDDKKGLISLGGSISKHYAIFSALLSGGFDYAVYMTTSHATSGSLSGATTQEAKSWGKLKDDAQAATVNGDVCITFPLMITSVLDKMKKEGLLE
jgi:deoxyhypusine synthase